MDWISVDEKLPEYSKPVFLTKQGCIFVGIRAETNIDGEQYLMFKHPKQPKKDDSKFTHWMPIRFPDLPK